MRQRLFLAFVAFVAIGILAVVGPAAAHSEVFERAPASGAVVGGVVDRVDISFWAPIASADIGLLGPDNVPIDVGDPTLSSSGRIVSVEFAPLVASGTYVVTHTEVSEDGDSQSDAFAFTFDPDSENEMVPLVVDGDGPNWVVLGGAAGLVLVVLAGIFWPGRAAKQG